jgi:integrase
MNEAKRERGQGRIFSRPGSKNLWIQYYSRGEQIRMSAETTNPKKARKLLRQKIGQVEAGVHPDTRRITYEELRETYYADYVTNRRKSLRRDQDGNPHMDKVVRLDKFFAGYKASEIDASLIRKFTAEQQAKGLENGSINRSISALRRMFHLAKEDGKIRDLPHFPMVDEAAPRKGFFERDEYETLFAALPDYLRLPFSIGYFSGMREGEILGLKWDQVKFLDGTIELLAGETKNDDSRSVPIIPQLRALLVEQYGKRQPDCPYVCFRLDRKGHAVKVQGFRKAWYSACVRSGLGKMEPKTDRVTGELLYVPKRGPRSKPKVKMIYQGKIFHDLRRTGVRNLVRAGVPEKVAMAISGHTTRSVFDRYNISSGKDFVEAGRKLEVFHGQGGQEVGDSSGTFDVSTKSVQRLPY